MAPTLSSLPRRARTRGANIAKAETPPRWANSWIVGRSGNAFEASQARTIPAFGRAINIIASQIASYPLHIFEESATGEPKMVKPPASRFLWGVPNPEMLSAFVFWRVVVAHKVLRENAFIFVVQDNGGRPIELWPINPTRVRVGRLKDGRKVYEVDGTEALLDYRDGGEIVHIIGDSEDGLVGIGPLQRYASAFELALSAEQYASETYVDGTPPGILKGSDPAITQDRAEELIASWMAKRAIRPRRPAFLTEGMSWETTSFNPEELQMIESRQFSVREVSRITGVPPHMLADTEASSNWGTGIEEQWTQFRTVTLNDHMVPIEQGVSSAFLPDGQWALFNPDAVLRPDTMKRYQAHEIGIRSGFLDEDEARNTEGKPPLTPAQRQHLAERNPQRAAAGQPGASGPVQAPTGGR